MTTTTRLAAGAALATLLLSGCTGPATPSNTPPLATTSPAGTSQTSTSPTSGTSSMQGEAVTSAAPDTVQAIDLGLSVAWASHNVGAAAPEEYGGYFGWADPTGSTTSTDNDEYPGPNPPAHISGTEYDAAHVQWGGDWRLPTHDEQQELVDRATWSQDTVNGVAGYRVTGPNGNSIFLPASGGRIGTETHYVTAGGDWWSGDLSQDDPNEAHYMWWYGDGHRADQDLPRHYGFAIRPVAD